MLHMHLSSPLLSSFFDVKLKTSARIYLFSDFFCTDVYKDMGGQCETWMFMPECLNPYNY